MANQMDANSDGIHTAMSDRRMGLYAGRLFGSIRSRRSTVLVQHMHGYQDKSLKRKDRSSGTVRIVEQMFGWAKGLGAPDGR